ncbi:MAG: thermonuclease family protein [Desulfotignum sp.]|nr:thermonuclease family protein [Desulfotignum sp.]MCF8114346.1 thermonuclease family protein [Desulfotignum sp.]MCF8125806.1 thermonuclease family protein [Desulfotignum sp.]
MIKFIRYLVIGSVLLGFVLPVDSDMFTWTDKDGIRHFSNISPPRDADNASILGREIQDQITSDKQFKVIKVYDGDSLLVQGLDLTFKIRMVGIDAPETGGRSNPGQPYSKKAHLYLSRLVKNRSVTLKSYGLGGYNRILAEVFSGGANLNLEMVSMGLAEVYQGSRPKNFDAAPYLAAQARAQKSRIGMWSQGSAYKSPRQWRKENPRN